jgi:hypothetical protein
MRNAADSNRQRTLYDRLNLRKRAQRDGRPPDKNHY